MMGTGSRLFTEFEDYPRFRTFLVRAERRKEDWKVRVVGSFIAKYNTILKQTSETELPEDSKNFLFGLIRQHFTGRLEDIRKLNIDEKNDLNSYIMARYRDYTQR